MKGIVHIKLLILCSFFSLLFSHAQIGNGNLQNNPFVGIWEYQDGNEIFRVELYLNNEGRVRGHYEMLTQNPDGTDTLEFKSNKDVGHGLKLGPVIYGGNNSTTLSAGIDDHSVAIQFDELGSLHGSLKMEIISSNPTKATWKVSGPNGLRLHFDERVFSIPTDVVMTKVE
jgi:hypothetical protein